MKRNFPLALPLSRKTISEILQPAEAQEQDSQKRRIRRSLFSTLRRAAGLVPFGQDIVASYFCAIDPRTPVASRGIMLAALAYFIMPADIVPDLLPMIGFTDDAAVLMAAIGAIRANIRPDHYLRAKRMLKGEAPRKDAS